MDPSGRAVADAGPGFDHPALLYASRAEYLAATLEFVRAAREADRPVLVAVPPDNLDLIRPAVGGQPDVWLADMSRAGRNPGRILPMVLLDFAARHAGRRPAIIGEPIWPGRSDLEYPACVVHEALINTVFAGRDATILCPYNTLRLSPRAVSDAYRTHPVMQQGGRRWASSAYTDPLALAAEFNRPLPDPPVAAAVREFTAAGGLAAVREFATAWAAAAGADADQTERLLSAVTELATNTIVHGGGAGRVRCWPAEDALVCQVEDAGHIADATAGRVPPTADRPDGRGLITVNALCDLVRIYTRPGATVVRIWLRRSVPATSAPRWPARGGDFGSGR